MVSHVGVTYGIKSWGTCGSVFWLPLVPNCRVTFNTKSLQLAVKLNRGFSCDTKSQTYLWYKIIDVFVEPKCLVTSYISCRGTGFYS